MKVHVELRGHENITAGLEYFRFQKKVPELRKDRRAGFPDILVHLRRAAIFVTENKIRQIVGDFPAIRLHGENIQNPVRDICHIRSERFKIFAHAAVFVNPFVIGSSVRGIPDLHEHGRGCFRKQGAVPAHRHKHEANSGREEDGDAPEPMLFLPDGKKEKGQQVGGDKKRQPDGQGPARALPDRHRQHRVGVRHGHVVRKEPEAKNSQADDPRKIQQHKQHIYSFFHNPLSPQPSAIRRPF